MGYLIAIVMEYIMIWYLVMIGACIISVAFGSYLFAITNSKCIKGDLSAIGQCTDGTKSYQEILDRIIEYSQYHANVKQLSK